MLEKKKNVWAERREAEKVTENFHFLSALT